MGSTVSIPIPEEFIHATRLSPDELRVELALHLYEKKKISLGKGCELAEMDKAKFMQLLGSRDISMNYDVAEFERDVSALREDNLL
jgi:predicted HTH domain antitoxin